MAVLGNAAALAEELLPRVASKLVPGGLTPELKDWKRQLQRAVDKLKDHLCKQVVLHFFLADDAEGESKLSPSTYLDMDNDSSTWHEDPNTSPMFQVWLLTVRILVLLFSLPCAGCFPFFVSVVCEGALWLIQGFCMAVLVH